MQNKLVAALLFVISTSSHAGSIYLCKAYSGGMFWASSHCNQHNALIERMVEVPDNLPWDQKVNLGEQARRGGSPLAQPTFNQQVDPNVAKKAECAAIDSRVEQLDAMARQPQSAATQDWIRSERKAARDRQFRLRC